MQSTASLSRRVAAVVAAISVTSLVASAAGWGRLPDRVAVQWDLDGTPNVFASRRAVIGLVAVTLALAVATALLTRAPKGLGAGSRRTLGAYGVFFTSLMGASTVLVVFANAAAAPAEPTIGWGALSLLLVPVCAVILAIPRQAADRAGRIAVSAGSAETVWRGRASAGWPLLVGAFIALLGFVVAFWQLLTGILLMAVALWPAGLARIEVTIHPDRLAIRYSGPLRWPESRIPLDAIEDIEVIDVVPRRHGGWGYRGSLRFLGWASVVLWRGPGLLIRLTSDRSFVVTVESPQGAVRAIRPLLIKNSHADESTPPVNRAVRDL